MSSDFFGSLSLIGWLGVFIRVAVVLSIPMKPQWWFNYYERFPKWNAFDDYTYTEVRLWGFMAIRFVVILFVVHVVTKLMFWF